MTDLFADVLDFHLNYDLPVHNPPQLLNKDLHDFRVKFMQEELQEYIDAWLAGDITKATDALVDLVYVALGTACFMGVPFNSCWAPVQHANMTMKYRANSEEDSKRGSRFDVCKLPDFIPPDAQIKMILEAMGAKV